MNVSAAIEKPLSSLLVTGRREDVIQGKAILLYFYPFSFAAAAYVAIPARDCNSTLHARQATTTTRAYSPLARCKKYPTRNKQTNMHAKFDLANLMCVWFRGLGPWDSTKSPRLFPLCVYCVAHIPCCCVCMGHGLMHTRAAAAFKKCVSGILSRFFKWPRRSVDAVAAVV